MVSKLILLILLFITSTSTIIAEDEEDALMYKLLEALTPTPYGWSKNTSHCQWKGVTCDTYNSVTAIQLSGQSLTGVLPSNLNDLSELIKLDLSQNNLTGPVPVLIDLYFLKELNLAFNNFTYINHTSFKDLLSLRSLNLSNNVNLAPWTFSDSITLSESDSGLESLSLAATNLYSKLPDIFTSFPRLRSLCLSHNNLSGEIPNSLVDTEIEFLALDNQKSGFSGSIAVLSSLIHLHGVWLQHNKLTGHVPDLTNLNYLTQLRLDNNFLTGAVPSSLAALPRLLQLSLENNMLTGPLPKFGNHVILTFKPINRLCPQSDDGVCDKMVLLEIAEAFGNPIQLASSWRWDNTNCQDWSFIVCQQGKVVAVNLSMKGLTGFIPPSFANLSDLKNLNLSGNNLRDSIPKSLTTLLRLESLDLSYNNLSGEVPVFPTRVKLNITNNPLLQSSQTHPPVLPIPWIAGALAVTTSIGFAMLIVIIYNRKRCLNLIQKVCFKKVRTFFNHNDEKDFMKRYSSLAPKYYCYSEIKKMTKSFQHKLGQGGFGIVYKGSLKDGRHVAVKVINESKGSEEEFMNEIISISRTSHVNIISLLGFCYEKNRKALIYEFMPNGSLDKFIITRKKFSNINCNLSLKTLYKIAIGIAQGLEYLHKECNTRIVHLDIKPQNILLDEDFCPKISDFGLAKLYKRKESIISLLGTRGTIGYIAPEVLTRRYGGISHKSDVYSYGMLILEIIGERNHECKKLYTSEFLLPEMIYEDLVQDNIHSSYSPIIEEEAEILKKMTMVSLWCIQTIPTNRPYISKVTEMLEGPLESVPFPPKPTSYSPNIVVPLQFLGTSSGSIHVANSLFQQDDVPNN